MKKLKLIPLKSKLLQVEGGVSWYSNSSFASKLVFILEKKENQAVKYHYTYTDHLGSFLMEVNKYGQKEHEQSFDAWGRKRNPTTWNYTNIPTAPSYLYRGYTGHEGMPEFRLINMNGRMYDPVVGRMLSADNYVQAGGYTQSYNRYSYAFNNPLKYNDPDGETALTGLELFANIGGVFLNASTGAYKGNGGQFLADLGLSVINGIIAELNPLDWNMGGAGISAGVSVTFQGGTDGISIGAEAGVSVGFGNMRFAQAYVGVSLYTNNYGTNTYGGHFYAGFGVGFGLEKGKNEVNGFWLRSTYFLDFAGETSQRVGGVYANYGNFKASYENDGFPFGGTLGDNGDSFRTASISVGWRDWTVNAKVYTGYRDFSAEPGKPQLGYPFGMVENPEANKYREGIVTLGYKNVRLGWNSEGIRHTIQNRFAHTVKPQNWFEFLRDTPSRGVIGSKRNSRYHTW